MTKFRRFGVKESRHSETKKPRNATSIVSRVSMSTDNHFAVVRPSRKHRWRESTVSAAKTSDNTTCQFL